MNEQIATWPLRFVHFAYERKTRRLMGYGPSGDNTRILSNLTDLGKRDGRSELRLSIYSIANKVVYVRTANEIAGRCGGYVLDQLRYSAYIAAPWG